MDLITIDEANDQLRLDLESDDGSPPDYSEDIRTAEVERMILAATAAAEDYMSSYIARETPTWDVATAPPQVKAAILMILAWLWEHRGDEDADAEGYLSVAVKSLLHRYHDPVYA